MPSKRRVSNKTFWLMFGAFTAWTGWGYADSACAEGGADRVSVTMDVVMPDGKPVSRYKIVSLVDPSGRDWVSSVKSDLIAGVPPGTYSVSIADIAAPAAPGRSWNYRSPRFVISCSTKRVLLRAGPDSSIFLDGVFHQKVRGKVLGAKLSHAWAQLVPLYDDVGLRMAAVDAAGKFEFGGKFEEGSYLIVVLDGGHPIAMKQIYVESARRFHDLDVDLDVSSSAGVLNASPQKLP